MPQIFHRSANTLSKVSLAGILLLVGGLIGLAMLLGRSSYVTRAQEYIEQPVPKVDHTDRLNSTLEWALANLREPLCLDALADRAAMSRRTFTRRFKRTTGTSVTQWLLSQRLAYAQRLLETTDQSVDRIAESSGFGSTASLRQHFTAAFSTSPVSYRRTFRGV